MIHPRLAISTRMRNSLSTCINVARAPPQRDVRVRAGVRRGVWVRRDGRPGLFVVVRAAAAFAAGVLPPADAQAVVQGLADGSTLALLLLVAERAVALPIRAFACVLIVGAVRPRRARWFAWSFLLKSAVDAVPTNEAFPEAAR